jgi:hypothetical protein
MTMPKPEGLRDPLASALDALADADASLGASANVERQLLEEVRSIARVRRRRRRMLVAISGLAAAVCVTVAATFWRTDSAAPVSPPAMTTVREGPSDAEAATAFLPLLYGSVPVTNGQVIRMEVPRRALASFGLASIDAVEGGTSTTVLADVLVGDDGLARAVRFVRRTAR